MAGQLTLFSRIIAGEIPADFVYRDEFCVAFRDIQAQAPVHLLIVPVEPIPSIANAAPSHERLLGHLLVVAARLGEEFGLATSGYRLIINHGEDAGQTVPHLHLHLIGGRPLGALVGGTPPGICSGMRGAGMLSP
ncbi:MAG: histidine triad nucleotide-binding protein [Thermomicrobia bacterium]|nr:histidine triad nucleotide-binding protein [Thermomicrobia bacterium]